jgi:hypothetical protein
MAPALQVTFDCVDPDRLATFWAAVLGYEKQAPPAGYASWPEFLAAQGVPEDQWTSKSAIADPAGAGPRIFFQRVPEAKAVKNRLHLDVNVGGGLATPVPERQQRVQGEVERLAQLGATRGREFNEVGDYWIVMQDPEGNEFCLQ